MPYNNAPITPTEEITGSSALPLARVKKIIAQDDEIAQCSNSAAFAISVATEVFVRYLTEQAHVVVKSERKPRRNIAYKDIATAISRIDNLEFLSDVVPKTKTYRQIKEDKAREDAAAATKTTPAMFNGLNGESSAKPLESMIRQPHEQTNGHRNGHRNGHHIPGDVLQGSPIAVNALVDRPVVNGHSRPSQHNDIEMSG